MTLENAPSGGRSGSSMILSGLRFGRTGGWSGSASLKTAKFRVALRLENRRQERRGQLENLAFSGAPRIANGLGFRVMYLI